ncbi:two-component sensor histidine kinase, partial [Mammaliicoccus sciuri]
QKQIVYDSKGTDYTSLKDFNKYKFHFPFTANSSLSSEKVSLKNANTLLLTNHLKVQNKDYTVASEIN